MSHLTVRLPQKGKILVSEGQKVSRGDSLAEIENKLDEVYLNLAKASGLRPNKVITVLVKKIGDEVIEGEIIARKKGLLGEKKIKSPISGTLEKLEEDTGVLTVGIKGEKTILKAPAAGKIVEIKNDEIVIDCAGTVIPAEKGGGIEVTGELVSLKNPTVGLYDLTSELEEKIVAAEIWTKEALIKAKSLQIKAILGTDFRGEMDVCPLTFLALTPDNFKKVLKYVDHQVIVFGEEKNLVVISKS
ncbi:hypothetical protein HY439_01540 [Candidatus Microgenomates bacterium]|nr:hypothetical protein [Candidatus Microgenomates bacterium]